MDNNDIIHTYMQNVNSSRNTLTNILNIMRDQERTLRDAVNAQINLQSQQNDSNVSFNQFSQTSNTRSPYIIPAASPHIPHIPHSSSFSNYQNYPSSWNRYASTNNNLSNPIDLSVTGTSIPSSRQMNQSSSTYGNYTSRSLLDRYRSYRDTENYSYTPSIYRTPLVNLGDLSPINIRPTISEIVAATTEGTFSTIENPINSNCPITRETFNPTDRVTRITHCGHIFTTSSFNEWFSRNIRCPVCRHDLRDVDTQDAQNNSNNETNTQANSETNAEANNETNTQANSETNAEANNETNDENNNEANAQGTSNTRPSINTSNTSRNNAALHTLDLTTNNMETILNYISNDIQTRINNTDLPNEIMIEYAFIIPPENTGNANNSIGNANNATGNANNSTGNANNATGNDNRTNILSPPLSSPEFPSPHSPPPGERDI